MSNKSIATIATMGVDIGENWFCAAEGGLPPIAAVLGRRR
jgi:hypothetical protein